MTCARNVSFEERNRDEYPRKKTTNNLTDTIKCEQVQTEENIVVLLIPVYYIRDRLGIIQTYFNFLKEKDKTDFLRFRSRVTLWKYGYDYL